MASSRFVLDSFVLVVVVEVLRSHTETDKTHGSCTTRFKKNVCFQQMISSSAGNFWPSFLRTKIGSDDSRICFGFDDDDCDCLFVDDSGEVIMED